MNYKIKRYMLRFSLLIIYLGNIFKPSYSQANYKIIDTRDIEMRLLGSSNINNWEMDAETVHGEAQLVFQPLNQKELKEIKSLTFALNIKDMQSNNKRLYKILYQPQKDEGNKDVHYKLSSSTINKENGGFLIKTNGILTIAGITKATNMDFYILLNENNTILCKGSYSLKMLDYKKNLPSLIWETINTADIITMNFAVIYKRQKEA